MKIPLYVPWITNTDKNIILSSIRNSQLTDGPILRKFESRFSEYVNSKFSIGVSNGTEALHLSLVGLGIGKGDEVIVPDLTFIATSNAVTLSGATPVLVDIDSSLNISEDSIKDNITKRTKAIIPVHFAGYPCDMTSIMRLASENNLYVIEDCAHALGSFYKKKHVGTFGDAGCFSFYPTKNITTIEGGMIITDSKKLAKKLESLRNHGLTRTLTQRYKDTKPWNYDIITPGYNFRLDEVRASLGLSQLSQLNKITKKRKNAAKYYNKKLQDVEGIEIVNLPYEKDHVYHLYIIRITKEFGVTRNTLHEKLFKKGIHTTVHYKPLHLFSYFKKHRLPDKLFPNSMNAYHECLTLPLFPTITTKQQDYVIDNILRLHK